MREALTTVFEAFPMTMSPFASILERLPVTLRLMGAALATGVASLLITVLRTESVVNPVFRERGWVGDEFARIGVALVVLITVWDLVATFLACRRSVGRRP